MFALKSKKNHGIVFVIVTLVLILLAEPILAQKGGRGGGGGGSRSQPSQPAPSAPKSQPAPSAPRSSPPSSPSGGGSSSPRVSAPSPSPQPQPRLSAPSSPRPSNPPATSMPSARQQTRMVTSPAPAPAAPSPQPGPVISSSKAGNAGSASRNVSVNNPAIVSTKTQGGERSSSKSSTIVSNNPSTPQRPASSASVPAPGPSEKTQVSSEKTNRIGSLIGREKQTTSTIENRSFAKLNNKEAVKESGRIAQQVGQDKPLAPKAEKQAPQTSGGQAPAGATTRADKSGDKAERVSKIGDDKKSADTPAANPPVIAPDKTSRIGGIIGKERGGLGRERKSSADSARPESIVKAEPTKSSTVTERATKSVTNDENKAERIHRADTRPVAKTSGEQAPPADRTVDKGASDTGVMEQGPYREHRSDAPQRVNDDTRAIPTEPRMRISDGRTRVEAIQKPQNINHRQDGMKTAGPRLARHDERNQTSIIRNNIIRDIDGYQPRIRRSEWVGSSHVVYDDCPNLIAHTYHPEHVYIDYHNRMCHREIWPSYYCPVYYSWGPHWTFRYFYPYYHRKYIFVSLGGYWPIEYTYMRYYWYGYHPYIWHGYYPIGYEVGGDTYNYYTYNYYGSDTGTAAQPDQYNTYNYYYDAENYIRPVDSNTFADVREKLARQAQQPDQQTLADAYFEEAVKAFEVNDFNTAALKFANAIELAPDDMILPFAYAQALMANEQYTRSAEVLRAALAKVSPEKADVFYPRGLYSSDDILSGQIDRLARKAEIYRFDADLQLLLGYQLLGIGRLDEAVEPLLNANQDLQNAPAATVLLNLLEKIKTENASQNQNTD